MGNTVRDLAEFYQRMIDEGKGDELLMWQHMERTHIEKMAGGTIPLHVWEIFAEGLQDTFAEYVSNLACQFWRDWDEDERREAFDETDAGDPATHDQKGTMEVDDRLIAAIMRHNMHADTMFVFSSPQCVLPDLAEKIVGLKLDIVPVDELWLTSLEMDHVDVIKIEKRS